MKPLKSMVKSLTFLLLFVLVIFGGYFLTLQLQILYYEKQIETERDRTAVLTEELGMDLSGYTCVDRLYFDSGKFYLIFVPPLSSVEGILTDGILIEMESTQTFEADFFELSIEGAVYLVPVLWYDGGGTTVATLQAVSERYQIRNDLLENHVSFTTREIEVEFSGSECLGKWDPS